MTIDKTSLLKMLHQVSHNSVWGIACRNVSKKDLPNIVLQLQSQSKDNPGMMETILGWELFKVVNNLTSVE